MPRLCRTSGKEVVRVLEQMGFEQVRQRGSHVVLKALDEERCKGLCSTFAQGIGHRNYERNFKTGRNYT